ncbi:sigma factor-like helix-turn-helix DNA-binding protein [Micromonospora sp. NPDC048999]|uniref:sigma factor-like helix-turn-helix DNA-binding protein n=1 Tax=Micromonospora sp. NPDC048999 TaxID=3155391 RepID=UPI0033C7A821
MLWLQPYPDRLLDELPAGGADEPGTVAVARETIELAYLVAVQHLVPRPRAVLILRDVLGWPAKDVAELIGDSVNSVNSALQRARAGMREHLPAERQDWTGGEEDAGTRELVRRFTDASVATDIDRLATLLRDDVRCSMPPTPGVHVGRDAVVNDWVEDGFEDLGHLRAVPTCVNRQPAVAFYLWRKQEAAADDRLPADHRRRDHRDHHLPPRPVPAARAAGAPAGGRHGVVPVWTLTCAVARVSRWSSGSGTTRSVSSPAGGCSWSCATASPGPSSNATPGSGCTAPASALCAAPAVARRGYASLLPGPGPGPSPPVNTPCTPVTE